MWVFVQLETKSIHVGNHYRSDGAVVSCLGVKKMTIEYLYYGSESSIDAEHKTDLLYREYHYLAAWLAVRLGTLIVTSAIGLYAPATGVVRTHSHMHPPNTVHDRIHQLVNFIIIISQGDVPPSNPFFLRPRWRFPSMPVIGGL